MIKNLLILLLAMNSTQAIIQNEKEAYNNSCLLAYSTKLDNWLTVSKAASFIGKPASEATFTYSKVMKNPAYQDCKYEWKTGRMVRKKIAGSTYELQEKIILGFGELQIMETKRFLQTYRAVTEEEMAAAKRETEKALDKKSGNEQLDQLADKADQTGVRKQEQKDAAGSILSTIGEVSRAYVKVTGVGDAAVWNIIENKLYVLSRGVKFTVLAELENAAENKSKAILVAKDFIRTCP